MNGFRTLLTGILLAHAGSVPAAHAAERAAGCVEEGPSLQAAVRLREQLGDQYRVCALGSLPDQTCDGRVVDAAVELLAPMAQGRAATMASFHCADGTLRRMPLWFSVERLQLTPLARHALPAGAWVVPGDFEWVERMRPVSAHDWSESGWTPGSRRLVRPLRAGDMLHDRDLRAAAAVEPGTPVEARLSQGAVSLRLDAVAMGGGAPGERIRVKSRRGGVSMPARVTGNHTVELLP
jgi:flagella basal body P-ring formation protein FlgA